MLVERFARAVLEDGIGVGRILAITFTEKAAGELRERIRARLRDAGAAQEARATEGAQISTIHGFCARLLRTHALAAGLDPQFAVLDEHDAGRLVRPGIRQCVGGARRGSDGAGADRGPRACAALRAGIAGSTTSSGARASDPVAPEIDRRCPTIRGCRALADDVRAAADGAARMLGAERDPPARVVRALATLERVATLIAASGVPWPGDYRPRAATGGGSGSAGGRRPAMTIARRWPPWSPPAPRHTRRRP